MGIFLGDRARDQVAAAVVAVQLDHKIGERLLAAVGQQALAHLELGARCEPGLHRAVGEVHAADLRGLHLHLAAFVLLDLGDRVDLARTRAVPGAQMLFHI